ncbi:MAG: acyl-CoA dehydrogenase family protein [Acidimicrobiales bacterium]
MDVLSNARDLRGIIQAHATHGETDRELAPEVVSAMREAGLFRMWVPQAFGGLGTDHRQAYDVFEEISAADGSAGWVLNQSVAVSALAAMMSDGGEEIYADPDALFAGALWPPGSATEVEGGFRVTNRNAFVSGVRYGRWILTGAAVVRDGEPQTLPNGMPYMITALVDPADAEVVETWRTMGMRATGSNDAIITDVFVPAQRTVSLFDRPPLASWATHPLYAVPPWYGVQAHAATPLGIARAALEKLVGLADTKVPAFFQQPIRTRSVVQAQAAEALGHLEAAMGYLSDSMDHALAAVSTGRYGPKDKARLQISGSHAGRASQRALDLVHQAVGTSGIRDEAGFERLYRDGNTITQHATLQSARFEDAGKILLGVESEWFPFLL